MAAIRAPARSPAPALGNSKARRLQATALTAAPIAALAAGVPLLWGRGAGIPQVALFLGMYALTTLGVTLGYHRQFAHRAFRAPAAVRVALAILGSMAVQGQLAHWVAVHRRHHAHADRPDDPHSPHIRRTGRLRHLGGLWHAHVGWMFRQARFDEAAMARDIRRDRPVARVQRLYVLWAYLGFATPAAAGWWLAGGWQGAVGGVLWGGLLRMLLLYHSTWSVNSICHVFGGRPFRTGDLSTNNGWLALLTFGESWHNNHHAFPSSARHGLMRGQVDLTGYAIRALRAARLVWGVKAPPPRRLSSPAGIGLG